MRLGRAGVGRARPQRARIFVGCEGASERGYVNLLRAFLDRRGLPIHLDAPILNPGAGDPHELVKRAVAKARHSAEIHGPYVERFLLLDSDRHDARSALGRQTVALAREHDMALLWQAPCHEAMLLRHLPNCGNLGPPTSAEAMAALKRHWPAYAKPMSSEALGAVLDEVAIRRAAQVEPDLRGFLIAVGLIAGGEAGEGRRL